MTPEQDKSEARCRNTRYEKPMGVTPVTKRGRPCLGDRPMTNAERMRLMRARRRAEKVIRHGKPSLGQECRPGSRRA